MLRLFGLINVSGRTLCNVAEEMSKAQKRGVFYAVRQGLKPGVYRTWEECKSQVDKFPSAIFKKFTSEKDAWAFVTSKSTAQPAVKSNSEGNNDELPRNEPGTSNVVHLGSKRPHEELEEEPAWLKRINAIEAQKPGPATTSSDGYTYMGDAVVVYTDGCCSANGKKGARAGIGVYWGQDHPLGGDVVNKEDFQKLDKLNSEVNVIWMHIPGHAGYTGNEEADRLSREGAAKPFLEILEK
ncbi:hypothetical protein DNTS_033278 [Danionella cerebrum]|uniref:ribonuclease H n=1 Tax=Danionella cerebrum TaxID=2873325 RepID=A0A553R2J7_9TELE|nr:hypothetical protein DNTS_033278 [Danionella translucida]